MLRRGRIRDVDNEEKVIEPLFPRIHVNDIEKWWPRAPPRNKIALCEQLSRPSQKLNSEGPSELPAEHHVISTLAPSASSSQADGQEKIILSPFIIPSAPAHSLKKVLSHSSDGMDLNAMRTLLKGQSTEDTNHGELNIAGNFSLTAAESSGPGNSSFSLKIFHGKTLRDEYEYRVSNYAQLCLATNSKRGQYGGEREKPTPFPMFPGLSTVATTDVPQERKSATCSSSMQLQNTHGIALKQANAMDLQQRQHARYPIQQKSRETVAQKFFFQNSASQIPNGEGTGQPAQYTRISLNKEHQSGSINENENGWSLQEAKAQLLPNNGHSTGTSTEPRGLTGNAASGRGTISRVQSESGFRAIFGNSHRSPKKAGNCHEETERKAYRSLQLGEADRNSDVSNSSLVDSLSGLDPSPDDVVGLIGQKHFWKARKTIINQQRVFAVQVFELHRLIRVQKLIAISPHLLLEDYPSRGRSSTKLVHYKKLHVIKSQRQDNKTKDDSQKPSQSTDCPTESAIGKTALHSPSGVAQISSCGHHPGNPPSLVPVAAKNNDSRCCFHLPGNQWLVPVISPSEGLVYKSYSGPHHPSSGDMAPVYGGCNPMNLPPVPAYGLQASHQQPGVVISGASAIAPNYFPPYGMLVMNPVLSPPAMEQVNSLSGSHGAQSHELACCIRKIPSYCEVQGSTASSPCGPSGDVRGSTSRSPYGREQRADHGGVRRDALPLFPMAPGFGQY